MVTLSLKHDPDASIVITGINENLYNSIFLYHPVNDSQIIQELSALQSTLKLPLTAWVTDAPSAPKLHHILSAKFSSPGPFYGMLLDLNKANFSVCLEGISIEPVTNHYQAEMYAKVFSDTFHFPNIFEPTIRWAVNQYETLNQSGISYIAKVNGVVAGVCSLIIDREFKEFKTGGFYNACVLPEFRKRGIGTAMACHRVKAAKKIGLKQVSILLMSNAMARGYCERLGFMNFATLTPYYVSPLHRY